MASTIISSSTEGKIIVSNDILKIKNSIWNKIISAKEFENFDDLEYFRWMEIYKDANKEISNVNPVSIEQKMALIEVINSRLLSTTHFKHDKISADIQKLNTYKLRKLQSHMKKFDLSSKLLREDLNDFAADLMIILKGPPISLLDYFTKNKTERMNERLMKMIQEDILLMGIKGMIERIPEKNSYTQYENAVHLTNKFFHLKIWKILVMPYDLPWFEKVSIPEELLKKIMLEGLDAHKDKLIIHLKKQNMIDHYERFRKIYRPVAFTIGFYFYYDRFSDKLNGKLSQVQEEEKEEFLEEFQNFASAIRDTGYSSIKSDRTLKEEQYNRLLKSYYEKYNEEPSEKEKADLRKKIFGNID